MICLSLIWKANEQTTAGLKDNLTNLPRIHIVIIFYVFDLGSYVERCALTGQREK